MLFSSFLANNPRKAIKSLLFRKSIVLVCVTLLLFLFLSTLGSADVRITNTSSILQQTTDQDEDGLSDALEAMLGTAVDDKFGDKDMDGLYDFEEYLDVYGNNDTDNQIYDYNDSTSYGDVLDIYHLFDLSSNKTAYLRDQIFIEENGGFTDYLLWNVIFIDSFAGGSFAGDVTYSSNILMNVEFNAFNTYGGGSVGGSVNYTGNTLTNVSFAGSSSGGSEKNEVSYSNNVLTNVDFVGGFAGGSLTGAVSYSNNMFTDVSFAGIGSGGSISGVVSYRNNTFTDVSFAGTDAGRSDLDRSSYTDNLIVDDSYDTDEDSLSDTWELIYHSVSGIDPLVAENDDNVLGSDTDGDGLNLTEEARVYSSPVLKDTDGDSLNDSYEVDLGTNPLLKDTDGDDLPDGWEVRYSSAFGVDPVVAATESELASDTDGDGLTLLQEAGANTDPETADNPMSTNAMFIDGISPVLLIFLVVLAVIALIVVVAVIVFFYKVKDKSFGEK